MIWWYLQGPLPRYHTWSVYLYGGIFRDLPYVITHDLHTYMVVSSGTLPCYHTWSVYLYGGIFRDLPYVITHGLHTYMEASSGTSPTLSHMVFILIWWHLQRPLPHYHTGSVYLYGGIFRALSHAITHGLHTYMVASSETSPTLSHRVCILIWWHLQGPLPRYHTWSAYLYLELEKEQLKIK